MTSRDPPCYLPSMVELAFSEYGASGPPLLVLHGLFGSARNWTGVSKSLAETHRVYAVDLRNHGASPHAPTMSYPEMAADVTGFIKAQGLEKPVIMGHSMGGKVAMRLALEAPDVPKALIVVDIAPVAYGHDMDDYIAAMQALDLSGSLRRATLQEELAGSVRDAGITAFLMTNLERAGDRFRWRVNLKAISDGMRDLTDFPVPEGTAFDGPVLFVAGENSAYIRDEHKSRIAALFPRSRTVTIKDAAHWVHADRPQAFLQTVQAFLGALG